MSAAKRERPLWLNVLVAVGAATGCAFSAYQILMVGDVSKMPHYVATPVDYWISVSTSGTGGITYHIDWKYQYLADDNETVTCFHTKNTKYRTFDEANRVGQTWVVDASPRDVWIDHYHTTPGICYSLAMIHENYVFLAVIWALIASLFCGLLVSASLKYLYQYCYPVVKGDRQQDHELIPGADEHTNHSVGQEEARDVEMI
jgi:hypothetical protein